MLLENVRGLLGRGLHDVLVDLARLGYDAQWDLISAAAVGAPHRWERVWIVAYPARAPIGEVFAGAPPVFAWPPEEVFLPRLTRDAVDRKPRLTALGNAVVPANVAHVWASTLRALDAPALVPPGLFGSPLSEWERAEMPVAGVMVAGLVHEATTTAPRITGRLWPTPAAQEADWSLDAISACVDKDGQPARDPHERFYHPETGQIVQRGLLTYTKGVEAGLWPTPSASDSSGGSNIARLDQPERTVNLVDAAAGVAKGHPTAVERWGDNPDQQKGGSLSPTWVEWLQGYPAGWTLAPTRTEAAA